jgi:hypothetical protein
VRQVIRAAVEIFPTFGMIGLLFISYLIWGTALRADSAQRQLSNELNQGRASRRVLAATGHTVNVASITRRRAEQAGRLGDLAKIALSVRLWRSSVPARARARYWPLAERTTGRSGTTARTGTTSARPPDR